MQLLTKLENRAITNNYWLIVIFSHNNLSLFDNILTNHLKNNEIKKNAYHFFLDRGDTFKLLIICFIRLFYLQ